MLFLRGFRVKLMVGVLIAMASAGSSGLAGAAGSEAAKRSGRDAIPGPPAMSQSADPELREVSEYERRLGHHFDAVMRFTGLPSDVPQARSMGTGTAATMREYARYGVRPLMVMEPTADDGKVDLTALSSPGSIAILDAYFAALTAHGVTDEEMGTWVLLPEPNLPEWQDGNTDPALFRTNFVTLARALKRHFPAAEVSLMLDSTVYSAGVYHHGGAAVDELLPYVSGLPAGLVDSFGLQGFPWAAADQPADYLSAGAAIACARRLGVRDVWFNTGTASRYRDATSGAVTSVPFSSRARQLAGSLAEAAAVRAAGLNIVRINLFGQAKLADDGADWSYTTPPDLTTLNMFGRRAAAEGIAISVFEG